MFHGYLMELENKLLIFQVVNIEKFKCLLLPHIIPTWLKTLGIFCENSVAYVIVCLVFLILPQHFFPLLIMGVGF
jgi:hypothetical protein